MSSLSVPDGAYVNEIEFEHAVIARIHTLLDYVQDRVSIETTEPWPLDNAGSMGSPYAIVKAGVIECGYRSSSSAVLPLEPLPLERILPGAP